MIEKQSEKTKHELSRCKPCLPAGREGMARVFAVQVQGWLSGTRVAVQS
jgi:hypothetical protein